ncbi:MAG TPA: nuclear transport factor 2 family protein [Methylibium sp.]|nr:nuclear transport factor 2 family protein [Methylibium sp.]
MRTFAPPRRRRGDRRPVLRLLDASDSGLTPLETGAAYGVYETLLAAWQRRDAAAIAAHFGPGGSFKAPGSGGRIYGPVIAAYAQDLFDALHHFRLEVTQVDAVADCVVDQWVVSGCWTGPFRAGPLAGVTPTGRAFALQGIGVIEVEDGRVRSACHYWDQRLFLSQVGAPPIP